MAEGRERFIGAGGNTGAGGEVGVSSGGAGEEGVGTRWSRMGLNWWRRGMPRRALSRGDQGRQRAGAISINIRILRIEAN